MAPPRTSAAPVSVLKQTKDIIASISFDLLIGKVAGFTTALVGAYLSARKIQEALRASAGAEQLKNQLVALGMSAAAAESKIASLSKMAANGAVSFESLGNAAKILRVIGGAAADTEGNLRQISDVFAASGAPVAAVATAYAQFYQAIKQGGDVSGAAQDMANLGGISQDTAQRIKSLQQAGAPTSQMLQALQGGMDSARGASEALRGTLSGLQAELKNLEQENNVKLGDKFIEGEKAGLRAAIAFERLKATLQSGLADAIAPIKNAWADLVEKIANSGSAEGAIRAITIALQALALVALGSLISAFGQGLSMLVVFANGLRPLAAALFTTASGFRVLQAGLGVVGGLLRGGLAILGSVAAAWTLVGAAIAKTALDSYAAYQNISKLNQEAQKSSAQKSQQISQNRKDISILQTPEERERKVDEINTQLEDIRKQKIENKRKMEEAMASSSYHEKGWFLTSDWKFAPSQRAEDKARIEAARDEGFRLDTQESLLKHQRLQAINRTGLGVDTEEDQRLRQKAILERQIRDQGTQTLQASLNPELGLQIGKSELRRLQAQYAEADASAPKTALDRRKINQLSKSIVLASSSQEYSTALNDLTGFQPTTKASDLDKEVVLRTSLREQKASLQQSIEQAYTFSEPAKPIAGESQDQAESRRLREASERRRQDAEKLAQINSVIASRYGGNQSAISAETTQELARQRDDEIKRMDPNALRQQMQAQMDTNQQLQVASGANEASIQKEKERVALEQQLASLSNISANAEYKAGAASSQRVEQLKKAKAASEELDKKAKEYQESIGTSQQDQKKKELDQAQVAAAKAGVEGRSTADIDQELAAEKQILEAKLSAARIAENAAKAEYDAANRRLALERQIVELRANQAQQLMGEGYGTKGENEIRAQGQDNEIAQKEQALEAARARDAADAAALANPTEQNTKAAREARERAAALGVTDTTNTRDVEAQLQDLRQQRAQTAVNEANQNNRSSVEMQIQGARIQERYAPNSDASRSAKLIADNLEDQLSKADRVKELTGQGMKGENAERVADIEVQRSRILSNIEKEGRPEVSSMARIGGASGWVGMVGGATQDKQARLESLNEQMVQLLKVLASDSTQGMSLYRTLLNNNK